MLEIYSAGPYMNKWFIFKTVDGKVTPFQEKHSLQQAQKYSDKLNKEAKKLEKMLVKV